MSYQIESHDNIQYLIKTATQTFGPYPSKAVAEATIPTLHLTEAASIVPTTASGKQVLFG